MVLFTVAKEKGVGRLKACHAKLYAPPGPPGERHAKLYAPERADGVREPRMDPGEWADGARWQRRAQGRAGGIWEPRL